jgi:predicted negative regulator of RcsB-dependent stress response
VAQKTKKTADKPPESDVDDVGKAKFDPKPVNVGGESLFDRIYPHRKKIGFFLLSGFLIWGVIAVVIHFRDSKREKGTRALANVLEVAERPVRAPGQAPDPKAKTPTFADPKERAATVLDTIAKEGTDAAGPTYKASLLIQVGKLDEAITELRKAQGQTGLDGVLARESLGLAIEQKAEAEKDAAARQKGLEEALAMFQAMQPDEKGPRRAYALYHQGRVLELLGKHAEAKTAFGKAKELGKEAPELAELIEQRLESIGS